MVNAATGNEMFPSDRANIWSVMGEVDWEAVKRLFAGARAQPDDLREAWLDNTCGDPAVRAEVRSLLDSLGRAGSFLEDSGLPSLAPIARQLLPDTPPARRLAAGDRLGRYVVLELVGAGGMGEVYRASDTRLDRTVVLKVLPAQTAAQPEWRARLEREARAVSSLNHPHVCALYDIGQQGDVDFLVMEDLEGETLSDRLSRGALPIGDVLTIGLQIVGALEAAHGHGIVHRDLKPANIMLTRSGAKLLDFGVAKAVPALIAPTGTEPAEPSGAAASLTQHGALVGTAEYMAPEQIDGRPVDQRTDIFALGAVLYEMTAGRKAFAAEDRASVLEAVRALDVPPLRRVRRRTPRSLDRIVSTCLAKDPGARYQTAAALQRDLTAVARAERRLLHARWIAAAVLTLVIGLGLSWPLLKPRQPAAGVDGGARIMLAVLPFANQSGDPGQDYLSEGLTDELITELGRLHPERLGVIARTSSVRYQQTRGDASRIARELGVDYFIEGSTARAGSRLRIGVRLARAGDQTQVWANRYEGELDNVLLLQADVARSIAQQVAVAVTPERSARLDARTAIDPQAFEHYLKGRYFWGKRTQDGLTRAAAEFEAATRKHPGYAAAYAGIADSHLLLAYYAYLSPDEAFSRARAAATKALELDPGLAEAHVSLAGIYDDYEHRWQAAEAEYREALRLNANYPTAHQWYANHLIGQGRFEEAQRHIVRARELDPLSLIIQVNVANIFLLSREYDRAIEECRKALEMEPEFVTARWVLGRAYELKRQFPMAIEQFQRGLSVEPESTLLVAALARTYALSGERALAEALLRQLSAGARGRYVSPLDLALVHAALGQTDKAFASLDRAVRQRANLLIYPKVDPAYDSLRDDPRFAAILRRLGLD